MERPNVFEDLLDYGVCSWIQCVYGFAGATMEMGNKTKEMVHLCLVNLAGTDFPWLPFSENSGLLWATRDI